MAKNKNDLFSAWLDAGRDWDKCRMIMRRVHSNSNESLSGWEAKPGKKLVEEYGKEKAEALMTKRHSAGLSYDNEDFPDDPLERFYWMRKAREMTSRNVVTDEGSIEGTDNLNKDMLTALIDENDGMFRAGAMPSAVASSSAGQKALLDGLVAGGVQAAPKAKPKAKAEPSEPAEPKSQVELATDLMASILAESTAARKKSMSLGAVNYAGELASQLLAYAEKMEKYYKTLQQATTGEVTDQEFYDKVFTKVEKDRTWFANASVGGGRKKQNINHSVFNVQKAIVKISSTCPTCVYCFYFPTYYQIVVSPYPEIF